MPGIHAVVAQPKTRMTGTRPGMTAAFRFERNNYQRYDYNLMDERVLSEAGDLVFDVQFFTF
jgi:hypothetical protein